MNIPVEIWEEIFSYLPRKTLGRFRYVCHLWQNAIVRQAVYARQTHKVKIGDRYTLWIIKSNTNEPYLKEMGVVYYVTSVEWGKSVKKKRKLKEERVILALDLSKKYTSENLVDCYDAIRRQGHSANYFRAELKKVEDIYSKNEILTGRVISRGECIRTYSSRIIPCINVPQYIVTIPGFLLLKNKTDGIVNIKDW